MLTVLVERGGSGCGWLQVVVVIVGVTDVVNCQRIIVEWMFAVTCIYSGVSYV